ncbi:hypothetical protein JW897_12355 [Chromobacterium alkanivorans]|uniref:hypothetical protein n=1 Tax=Chromobacterium alkanivorans TaxID=1071719 RepID=UPI0019686BFE|nr:hypothetical protein [Chromobacterium alkanivorans]MBN3004528.1 hypothetical protein [Chromobacterium alkanivorans]
MTHIVRRRVALFFIALASGFVALLAFRSLVVAAAAAVWAGLSAQAIAGAVGAGKAGVAAGGAHVPALVGALMGAALQLLQLKARPLPERIVITLVSFVAAYFGGVAGAERWGLESGWVGVIGTAAAYLAVPLLDAARAMLGDIGWLKRLVSARIGVSETPPQ